MDNSSVMIGLFLLALFILPIVYVLVKQNSKDRKQKGLIKKVAAENNLNLDKLESYGHLSLGLDNQTKKLLIADFKEGFQHDIIDLKKVDQIKLSKKLLPDTYSKSKKERIIHLSLCIEMQNASKITEITFYDEDDELSNDADIRLHDARKWDDMLNKSMIS